MKKLYLVRHGESDANAGGPIKPDSEVLLTELGHEQAKFLGQRATKLGIEALFASTMPRAQQTAEHISQAIGLPVETTELIVERRYPSGQLGLTINDPVVKEISHMLEVQFGDDDANHSDEETFEELRARAIRALEYFKNRPEEILLAVSHGIFLRVMVAIVVFGPEITRREMGKIIHAFKTKNTGLTLIEYDEEKYPTAPWYVRTWNDHAHLG